MTHTATTHTTAGKSYVAVVEGAPGTNYSAYVPDLPGCVATGHTVAETEANIADAIAFHLESMRAAGEPIPVPRAVAATVIAVA